jgi:LPS O-antigen subunit length determinant protein (WzzB/FepE family)
MRGMGTAAIVAFVAATAWLVTSLVSSPAYAQTPHVNLLSDLPSKTPEEREADEAREKAYKDSLRKIPEAKAPSDPWGGVRSSDAPKTSTAKAPAKKTKTGSNVN